MKPSPYLPVLALLACACVSHPAPEPAGAHPTPAPVESQPAAQALDSHPTGERFDAISADLREMGRVDQDARKAWIDADNKERGSAEAETLRKRVIEVDGVNTARLRTIIDEIGWPRRSVVGHEAASGAWLIAQHSGDDEFQTHALELLKPLLDEGEVSKPNYALLDDRVHCHRGEPQTYGTQYRQKLIDGVVHFGPVTPIPDPEHLDERRASMGLEPHVTYVAALKHMYHIPDDAVIDP